MSILDAPVHRLTIDDWHDLTEHDHGCRVELVRGHPIMTPTEAFGNLDATLALARRLDVLRPTWTTRIGPSLLLAGEPQPTIRVPDLAVLHAGLDRRDWFAAPRDVALVVEVVSPGSIETDWVAKREEYAAAGIPAYLIVDVRDAATPRVWLFDTLIPAAGGESAAYADAAGDGSSVTLRIPGCEPVQVSAGDLV